MNADAHLQAWLDIQAAERQVIAPYVRSAVPVALTYDLRVVRTGIAGRAETRQNGRLLLQADEPTPLGTLSINTGPRDACEIELILMAQGHGAQLFNFACPVTAK